MISAKKAKLISSLILAAVFLVFQIFKPQTQNSSKKVLPAQNSTVLPQNSTTVLVTKVVDGDTIEVFLNGKTEKVRIIGINTPETVDPRKPVECFGRQASDKAKSLLSNQTVRLESDPSQSNKDKYGRLLRHVFLNNETDFGLQMIKEGYAYEYTYDVPYKYQTQYKDAQKEAESLKIGFWGEGVCKK
jgi:micrococcal nuclease